VTGSGPWPRPTLIVCHLCPGEALVCHRHRAKSARPGCSKSARVYSAHHYLPQRRSRVSLRHARSPAGPRCASASWPAWASPSGNKEADSRREAPAPTAPRSRQTRPPTRCWPRRRLPSADRQALAAGRDAARALPARGHLPLARPWHGRGLPAVRDAFLPAGATSPLLWLTAPDPRWPDALVCPLKPDGAHKRALWQQCRQRHTLDAHDHGTAMVSIASLNPVRSDHV
jgi:hypothetical protein